MDEKGSLYSHNTGGASWLTKASEEKAMSGVNGS